MLTTLLGAGTDLYINEPSRWHITIFHTSKFDDTRPNPLGPAPSQIGDLSPSARQLSSPAELQQEKEAMQQVVAESPAATLEVSVAVHGCIHAVSAWSKSFSAALRL